MLKQTLWKNYVKFALYIGLMEAAFNNGVKLFNGQAAIWWFDIITYDYITLFVSFVKNFSYALLCTWTQGMEYKEPFTGTAHQVRINDTMASWSILAGDVPDMLLKDDSDLSDKDISKDDDEDYIYGYLGDNLLPPKLYSWFPSEDKVTGTLEGPSIEKSFCEDGSHNYRSDKTLTIHREPVRESQLAKPSDMWGLILIQRISQKCCSSINVTSSGGLLQCCH